jgi:alpha-methylacyl-CoA racemase
VNDYSSHRASDPPLPPEPPSPVVPSGPLAGVVVLDLSSVGPAARCTRLLADYGATVVKVGAVPGRGTAPIRPPFYAYSGSRAWRRIAIDLKSPEGRDVFAALARTADVVVESFRPGVMDRLSIGFDALTAINRRIILCSTTGYGQTGPRSDWAGHDINYLAVGGYLASSEPGDDGGPPIAGATVADAAGGGMHAALAIMSALIGRQSTGIGTHLDVSIADGVLWLTSLAVDEYLATGADVGPAHDIITGRFACYDTYRTADGSWLAVGAIEPRFFANLCRRLGCEQWIDRQLDDDCQPKIRADFKEVFATKDRATWLVELAGADTCVAPVLSAAELVEDEQYASRNAIVDAVMHDAIGAGGEPGSTAFRQVGPVLAGMEHPTTPVVVRDPNASDVESILTDAGIAPERIDELRSKGVVA